MAEFPFNQEDCQTLKNIFENNIKGGMQNLNLNMLLGFLTGLACTSEAFSSSVAIKGFLGNNLEFDNNLTSNIYITLADRFYKHTLMSLINNSSNSTHEYRTIIYSNNVLVDFKDASNQDKKDFLQGFCIVPSNDKIQKELLSITNELKKEISYNDEKDPIIHYLILLSILRLASDSKSYKYEEIEIISNYSSFKKQIVKFAKLSVISENINTIIGNLFEITKFIKECNSHKLLHFMKNEKVKMDLNDVCLCGSGIKYSNCCSNINATIH